MSAYFITIFILSNFSIYSLFRLLISWFSYFLIFSFLISSFFHFLLFFLFSCQQQEASLTTCWNPRNVLSAILREEHYVIMVCTHTRMYACVYVRTYTIEVITHRFLFFHDFSLKIFLRPRLMQIIITPVLSWFVVNIIRHTKIKINPKIWMEFYEFIVLSVNRRKYGKRDFDSRKSS